jgi:AraC family transcriptional regulator, transcriptional activator of pobA
MDRSIEIWYFSTMKKSRLAPSLRPARIEFARGKYGRELLVDAAFVKQMPTFITDCSPHSLAFYDILLITRGCGDIWLDGDRYSIEPGVVILCMPGQVREWRLRGQLDGACVFFADTFVTETFTDPRFLEQFLFFRIPRPTSALLLDAGKRRLFLSRFATMRRELASLRIDTANRLRAGVYELLVLLNRWYIEKYGDEGKILAAGYVERFRVLVERNFSHCHRVSDYARELRVTPGYLNALCRSQLHLNAGAVIRARIALEARRMLLYSNNSAARVAHLLGFQDPSYFTRFFRREVGQSPTQFTRRE